MSFAYKAVLLLTISFCTATAQFLFSSYAKELQTPFYFKQWLTYSICNPFLYAGMLLYGMSFVMFVMLLRVMPVPILTMSIVILLTVILCIYNSFLGERLNYIQYIGLLFAILGMVGLNWKFD